jgi:ABC-type phosphate/phosphonate transport system substrate-binding protein
MFRVAIRFWLLFIYALAGVSTAQADLILSSAPRDTKEMEEAMYKPLTNFLTRVTGQKVSFRYGDNFLVYQSEMRKGNYDIILDGPAFVGWRMAKLGHVPLVKFPGNLVFVLAVKKDQVKINAIKDMAGRTICAFPSPNLATLTVLDEFDNPARQPMILESTSFLDSYKSMVAGKCVGAILQKKLFENLDKEKQMGKVLFTSKPLPNQAFSSGPKVDPEMRAKIVAAMLSPEGLAATKNMRDAFKVQKLEAASVEEYQGLGRLIRYEWGFEQ